MNILLSSVGRRSYMVRYFKKALGKNGLVHAGNSEETYAMQIADRSVITPPIYDATYIDFLFDYCRQNDIKAIIPLFDIDLPVLSRYKEKFAHEGINIIVSDHEFVQICNDKWRTYIFLKENGFNTPHTFLSVADVISALKNGLLKFPLMIKPRWGMGSIGVFEADNENELLILFNKSLNSIKKSYLYYESQQNIEKSIIIQEKINGQEFGLDIFNDLSGRMLCCVPKKKLAMRAGETDYAEIIKNDQLGVIGARLSKLTKHIGNLDVDCFYANGNFYILELNCRFGGQYPFSHLAGVNFPKAIISMLSGEQVGEKILRFRVGVIGLKDLVPKKMIKRRPIKK
ncbi:MAG TPA: carbamoyl phosphate synthase-like protein [Bacteroidales bacterium]|nr:carbamoyl phosphate synthase-like protein [Bacteroidales bacterium]